MFVKVCGLTEPDHILWAAELGYDAVGFVLHPGSPRYCAPSLAAELACLASRKSLLATVAVGLVFAEVAPVRNSFDFVQVYSYVQTERLILAGTEAPDGAVYEYFLYDRSMGSGRIEAFPYWLSSYRGRLILSGGLHPGNVSAAVRNISPFGVDVSSGVEEIRGKKSYRLMKEFIREARGAAE